MVSHEYSCYSALMFEGTLVFNETTCYDDKYMFCGLAGTGNRGVWGLRSTFERAQGGGRSGVEGWKCGGERGGGTREGGVSGRVSAG